MFNLDLVTPEKKVVLGQELDEITLPAYRGELNILPGHAPLMTTLIPGILKFRLQGQGEVAVAISWGYCQVSASGVSVLAEAIVEKSEVDAKAAEGLLRQFENRMLNEPLSDADWENTRLEIARLQAEIQLVQTH